MPVEKENTKKQQKYCRNILAGFLFTFNSVTFMIYSPLIDFLLQMRETVRRYPYLSEVFPHSKHDALTQLSQCHNTT